MDVVLTLGYPLSAKAIRTRVETISMIDIKVESHLLTYVSPLSISCIIKYLPWHLEEVFVTTGNAKTSSFSMLYLKCTAKFIVTNLRKDN